METWNESMNRTETAVDTAASRAHTAADRVSSRAHETVDRVASAVHQAADRLSANSEQWMASGDQMMNDFRGYVRERPIAAVAGALAIGFLLAKIMR